MRPTGLEHRNKAVHDVTHCGKSGNAKIREEDAEIISHRSVCTSLAARVTAAVLLNFKSCMGQC